MTLSPPLQPQGSPVQPDNQFAKRLALLGKPGPFKSSPHNPGLVVDRAGHPINRTCITVEGAAARRDVAEITALALNRLCGLPAIEDALAPEHIEAVRAESARFAAQVGGRTEAAE